MSAETPRSLSLTQLLTLARPEAARLLAATVFLLLGAGLGLAFPAYIGEVIDGITSPEGAAKLDGTILWLLLLFALMGLATALRAYLFTVAGERIVTDLRTALYGNLMRQDIAFFDAEKTGDLMSRLGSDTEQIQGAVTWNLSMGLRFLVMGLGSVGIMAWTSWRLTLVMLAIVPIAAIGATMYVKMLRRIARQVRDALARASALAEESLAGIRTVRAFAREAEETAKYGAAAEESFGLARRRAAYSAWFHGGMAFAGYGAIAGVLWVGGRMVAEGALSFGELSAFILYTFTLAFSISALSGLWGEFAKALGASERVFELLEQRSALPSGEARLEDVRGELRFEDVRFAYPTRPHITVLDGIALEMRPGESVALVGPSGAGKSTIAALISRFYDPQAGCIRLDGRDLKELDATWLRQQVGVVPQEPLLFGTSILENIRYGRPEASWDEVRAAAQAANAEGFIEAFPEGYETLVGERGVRLSGGQRQRVAIARALLEDPQILILDEATSALDAESEHLVREALERLIVGRTTLIIAHRLSTVRDASRVLVLDGGRIVQQGTHAALTEQDGLYRKLVDRQLISA